MADKELLTPLFNDVRIFLSAISLAEVLTEKEE
jgi:hypothetical protein